MHDLAAILPMQFSSLEALDARVEAILRQPDGISELSPRTKVWLRHAYRSFRGFLKVAGVERAWLGPDVHQQLRVLDRWVASMREDGKARATVSTRWRGLRTLLNRIAREDRTLNPLALVKAPHPGHARLGCLTPDAAAQVLLYAQNEPGKDPFIQSRNAALVGVMLLAGLRKREALQLRLGDVVLDYDREKGEVRVAAGKGRHGGIPRTVPMTRQLFTLCAAYLNARSRVLARHTVPLTEESSPKKLTVFSAFFVGSHGRTPLSDITLRRVFRRVSRATGIHVSPHMLRHSFCTLLSRSGVPDRLAREAMGHADLRMLQRYQHIYPGELAAEMDKLRLDL